MREYVIVLPLRSNAGEPMPVEHQNLTRALVQNFEGYTFVEGTGAWMDDNAVVQEEPVVRYIIAANDNAHNAVKSVAMMHGRRMGQKAVYFVGKHGVEIIDLQSVRLGDGNTHVAQEESKLLRLA